MLLFKRQLTFLLILIYIGNTKVGKQNNVNFRLKNNGSVIAYTIAIPLQFVRICKCYSCIFVTIQVIMPPLQKRRGILLCTCRSVGLSVRRPNGFRVTTKERLGLGTSNLVW
jgi:hypothetical protein